jgi:hypothetical protein
MKSLLRRVLPASRRPPRPCAISEPAWTYHEDGLATAHVTDFLHDSRFQRAYAAGKATGSWGCGDLRWRLYTVLWAAEQAWRVPGDFIECGVHKGGQALAILHYLDWSDPTRCFYLLDTFHGFPPEHRPVAASVHRDAYREDSGPAHSRSRAADA